MENALYDFHSLVDTYQKSHSFAALTRSFSDTTQLVNKNRTRFFHEVISMYQECLYQPVRPLDLSPHWSSNKVSASQALLQLITVLIC